MRLVKALAIAAILAITSVSLSAAQDWTNAWQNERNDREEVNIKLPLKEVWKKVKVIGTGNPVYMDGKVYLLYIKEGFFFDKAYINEVDIKKGKVIKSHLVGKVNPFLYIRMIGHKGIYYISRVWLDDSKDEAELHTWIHAYDLKQEKIIWEYKNKAPFTMGSSSNIGAWLNVYKEKLVLASFQIRLSPKLYCLDANTGKELWKTKEPSGKLDSTMPIIADGTVFVGTADSSQGHGGHIAALDIETGEVVWDREMIGKNESIENEGWVIEGDSNLIYKDNKIYVSAYNHPARGSLRVFQANSGKEIWNTNNVWQKGFHETGLIDMKYFYGVGFKTDIRKYDLNNGLIVWKKLYAKEGLKLWLQTSEWICCSIKDEGLNKLIFINKSDGAEIAQYELPSYGQISQLAYISSVTPIENHLLVGIEDGTYYLFEGSQSKSGDELVRRY